MSFQRSLVLVSLLVASASSMHTPYALRDVHRGLFHKRLNTPSPLVSRDLLLENAIAAQSLNAQFASLDANSACSDGQVACIGDDFAECWQGKYVTTKCLSGLKCYALPSVNEAGTTVTCDTPNDAAARLAAAGSSTGITGSGSTSGPTDSTSSSSRASSSSSISTTKSTAQSTTSSTSQATSTIKASSTPTATIRGAAASKAATTSTQETTSAKETSSTESSSSSTHSSTHSSSSSSSAPAQQTPSSTLSSSNSVIEAILSATVGDPNKGQATWYDTGLTACGDNNSDSDFIVAVSEILFDGFPGATANPNENPVCGRKVQIKYGGNTQTATVTDRCTACAVSDLDMTPTLFQAVIGDLGIGRASGMEWSFI